MLPQAELLYKYVSGKKYKHATEWYAHDYSQYKDHYIVPGRTPRTMYCQVTRLTLNQIPEEIEKHISGRKYKNAKIVYEQNIERKKASNAKRDAKARMASERGWSEDKPKRGVEEADGDDNDERIPQMRSFETPKAAKRAWHEDMSDLNPDLAKRGNIDNSDEEGEGEEDMMAYMEEIAESDEEAQENGKSIDVDSGSDSESDEVVPVRKSKSKSKESKKKSKKETIEESSEEEEVRAPKKKSRKHVSELIEEDLAPKFKSPKEKSKESSKKKSRELKKEKR